MALNLKWIKSALVVLVFGFCGVGANAQILSTVDWFGDSNSSDGVGSGTLFDGISTINVDYSTVPGVINSATSLYNNWNASHGTNSPLVGHVTHTTGGIFGAIGGSYTQTINFSSAILDPVLLFNYTDPTSTIDFGALPFTLLDSSHASVAGSLFTFGTSTDNFHDGFAVKLSGSYSTISFDYFDTPGNTIAFTVGVPVAAAAPEASSVALLLAGGLPVLGLLRRHLRK